MSNPESANSTDVIVNLINGTTLRDLTGVRDETIGQLKLASDIAERLQSSSKEAVLDAIKTILSLGSQATQDFPGLDHFKDLARPSHYHTPLIEAALRADVPVWLHGEAGSGKSTTGSMVAESLGLDFRAISLGPTTSKSDLLGYRDATGHYHDTGFRRTYEDGGCSCSTK